MSANDAADCSVALFFCCWFVFKPPLFIVLLAPLAPADPVAGVTFARRAVTLLRFLPDTYCKLDWNVGGGMQGAAAGWLRPAAAAAGWLQAGESFADAAFTWELKVFC